MKQQEESMDKQQKYDPNRPETEEEDGLQTAKLRIFKVLRQSKMPQELIDNTYPLLKNMGLTTELTSKDMESLDEDNIDNLKISNQKNNKPKTTNMKTFFKFLRSIFLQFLLSIGAIISWINCQEIGNNFIAGTYEKEIDYDKTETVGTSIAAGFNGGSISMGIICCVCIIMIVWIEINKKNR
jgi:hypothetical protein